MGRKPAVCWSSSFPCCCAFLLPHVGSGGFCGQLGGCQKANQDYNVKDVEIATLL